MTEKNTNVRRIQIQNAIAPGIKKAIAEMPELVLNRPEDQRRLMRAAVHIVADLLLDNGADPNALAGAAIEAIGKELNDRVAKHDADGTFAVPAASA